MAVIEPTGVAAASAGPAPASSTRPSAGNGVVVAYVVAYFTLYIALLTPVVSTLALKIDTISSASTRAGDLGLVAGVGAFFAFVVNPIAGALSDRTTSRWGMRKPWLVGGIVVGTVGLGVLASATSLWMVVLGWAIAQAGYNGAQGGLQALLPDQVEVHRRGKVSGWLGIAQNVSSLVGIALATLLTALALPAPLMIVLPAVLAIIGMAALVSVLKDRHLPKAEAEAFHLGAFLKNFWVSPRKHPDFGWAFLGRFLMLFGFATYNNYQVYFLLDRFGFDQATALSWQLRLSVVQAVVLVAAAAAGGWLSDRSHRRKIFVIIATVLAGRGLLVFASAQSPNLLFVAAALFGAGLGAYFAVDLALVTDVLPNRDSDAAKNMGVFNIANALPQSLAPALAPLALAIGSATASNYTLLFVSAAVIVILGAVSTMLIRGAR